MINKIIKYVVKSSCEMDEYEKNRLIEEFDIKITEMPKLELTLMEVTDMIEKINNYHENLEHFILAEKNYKETNKNLKKRIRKKIKIHKELLYKYRKKEFFKF